MAHAESEHGLRVQLATALKERDEARHGLDEWCKAAMQERARVTAAESERDALRAELEAATATFEDEQAAHQETLEYLAAARRALTTIEEILTECGYTDYAARVEAIKILEALAAPAAGEEWKHG